MGLSDKKIIKRTFIMFTFHDVSTTNSSTNMSTVNDAAALFFASLEKIKSEEELLSGAILAFNALSNTARKQKFLIRLGRKRVERILEQENILINKLAESGISRSAYDNFVNEVNYQRTNKERVNRVPPPKPLPPVPLTSTPETEREPQAIKPKKTSNKVRRLKSKERQSYPTLQDIFKDTNPQLKRAHSMPEAIHPLIEKDFDLKPVPGTRPPPSNPYSTPTYPFRSKVYSTVEKQANRPALDPYAHPEEKAGEECAKKFIEFLKHPDFTPQAEAKSPNMQQASFLGCLTKFYHLKADQQELFFAKMSGNLTDEEIKNMDNLFAVYPHALSNINLTKLDISRFKNYLRYAAKGNKVRITNEEKPSLKKAQSQVLFRPPEPTLGSESPSQLPEKAPGSPKSSRK
jgi:hypothetical protein